MLVEFSVLEVLCLERNRLERDESLLALSTVPRLRELNLAHNFFRRVSSAVTHSGNGRGAGGFGCLEWLAAVPQSFLLSIALQSKASAPLFE